MNERMATNHNSKDLEYDLTSQQRTSLNQTNDHLDAQAYVQIRETRHLFQTRASRHLQTRIDHSQPSTNASRIDIAKHFEFWNLKRFLSLGITFVVEQRRSTPASWTFLKTLVLSQGPFFSRKREKKNKMMFAKYYRSSSILHVQRKRDKTQKLCKTRMGGT